jgi:hypothetical protein
MKDFFRLQNDFVLIFSRVDFGRLGSTTVAAALDKRFGVNAFPSSPMMFIAEFATKIRISWAIARFIEGIVFITDEQANRLKLSFESATRDAQVSVAQVTLTHTAYFGFAGAQYVGGTILQPVKRSANLAPNIGEDIFFAVAVGPFCMQSILRRD